MARKKKLVFAPWVIFFISQGRAFAQPLRLLTETQQGQYEYQDNQGLPSSSPGTLFGSAFATFSKMFGRAAPGGIPPPHDNTNAEQNHEQASQRRSCGECCNYGPIESAEGYSLDPWYKKVLNFKGLLIVASDATADAALYEAALTIDRMTAKRPDLITTTADREGVKIAIAAQTEELREIPEYADIDLTYERGLGATGGCGGTFTGSCSEENLLCLEGDPYYDFGLLIHEGTHTLLGHAQCKSRYQIPGDKCSGTINDKASKQFQKSVVEGGLWANTYSATNYFEYIAQGANSFFNANIEGPQGGNGVFNDINTREELREYDPELFLLLEQLFPTDITKFPCPTNVACNCSTFECPVAADVPPPPCNFVESVRSWVADWVP